jgi:hypothetical protein
MVHREGSSISPEDPARVHGAKRVAIDAVGPRVGPTCWKGGHYFMAMVA